MISRRSLLSTLAVTALLGSSLLAQGVEIRDVERADPHTGDVHRYLEIEARGAALAPQRQEPAPHRFLFLIAGTDRTFVRLGGNNELHVLPKLIAPLGAMSDTVRIELPLRMPGHVYVQAALLEAGTFRWTLSEMLDLGDDSNLDEQSAGSADAGHAVAGDTR